MFDRGIFTLSLDFELIWGTLDHNGLQRFGDACRYERQVVVDRLIALLETYEISATWCVLGHLFLDGCQSVDGVKHPEIPRPHYSWVSGDWFEHDPETSEVQDPIFYGPSLIKKIRACAVPQEIGSHSFSHVVFGDPGCSRATAQSEVARCVELAEAAGIRLRSFAFPRNVVGYLDVLKQFEFTAYRGPEPDWYRTTPMPKPLRRMAHLLDVVLASQPPVVMPERHNATLWNIPGSMILLPMHGIRRWIPVSRRVRRAIKGLDAAAARRRIFHLWFHPTNLAIEPAAMFTALEQILQHVRQLRDRGAMEVMTMGAVARAAQQHSPSTSLPLSQRASSPRLHPSP
jgi:peptidoglycan/xylan/chitin deacetylase (PgdA/CDA1 family)